MGVVPPGRPAMERRADGKGTTRQQLAYYPW